MKKSCKKGLIFQFWDGNWTIPYNITIFPQINGTNNKNNTGTGILSNRCDFQV